ncbi:MAG: phage holin family protein [Bradyrhizobiaceae bacterium]|nr:phage holin family protein [Bradyrhizobiaceae bacterium]
MVAALMNELRGRIDAALKLAVAGSIFVIAGFAAFVCFTVAIFLWTQQTYGSLEAWIAIGALFLVVAVAGAIALLVVRRRARSLPPPPRRAQPATLLQDPAVIVAGLQLVRTLSARGVLPLLVIGAIAGGLVMNRNGHSTRHHAPSAERGTDTGAGI